MRRLAKEGTVIGIGQLLVVAARFAPVWWLTRVLDPRSFGEVALIQGATALGYGLPCGSLLQAGLRFQWKLVRVSESGAGGPAVATELVAQAARRARDARLRLE